MMYKFFNKYKDKLVILCFFLGIFFLLFYGMSLYPLIDVDETRYASIAREMFERKNWLTLYFNGNFFFEKPPLYFWIVAISYKLFGNVSEFTTRIFISCISSLGIFYTYYIGRKIVSHKFGLMSGIILASSLFYILLTRVAILDIILSVMILASVFSGFLAFFVQEKNKKYFWWLAYFFSGLAVLAKGIPGVAIPSITLFVICCVTKNLKEFFKPINIVVGVVIFFALTLPWHIIMLKTYGSLFFYQYVLKHHLARFINSENLGRKQPFLFYIPVILSAVFPWTFVFIDELRKFLKKLYKNIKANGFSFCVKTEDNTEKLIIFSRIYIVVVFLFFSLASTKLPTYMLPLLPPSALIIANYWCKCFKENKTRKSFTFSNLVLTSLLVSSAFLLMIVINYLPDYIASQLRQLSVYIITFLFLFGGVIFYFTTRKMKKQLFFTYVIFMVMVIYTGLADITKIVINGGENELIDYAKYVKRMQNSKFIAYNFGVRPSTLFYYGKYVEYMDNVTNKQKEELENRLGEQESLFVIIKNIHEDDFKLKNTKLIKKGHKYSLLSN